MSDTVCTLSRVNDRLSFRYVAAAAFVAVAYSYVPLDPPLIAQQAPRPAGWDETSHGSRTRPDYQRVFSLDQVHELHITIAPDRFRAMQEDLRSVLPGGGFGRGGPFPGGGPGPAGGNGVPDIARQLEGLTAACRDKKPTDACTADGVAGQCNELPFGGGGLVCMPGGFAGGGGGFGRGRGAPNMTTRDPMYVPVTVTYAGRTWTQVGMRYKGN